MNSFHNTINVSGQMLLTFEQEAQSLEETIKAVFLRLRTPMSWSEVKRHLDPMTHEGSIKRAITNLKTKEVLEKTPDMVCSPYGKPSHRYKLK